MSGAPRLRKNSFVEALSKINSQVTQVFNFNILRFEFPNILSLLCVAIVTNLSVFSLMNDVCRIALWFSVHKICTFFYYNSYGLYNAVVDNFLRTMVRH